MENLFPIALRLKDILPSDDTPIVDFDYPNVEEFTNNPDIQKIMYDAVVRNYMWAYINADNKEQFVEWFTTYWQRNIVHYLPIFLKQIELSHSLYKARIEEFGYGRDTAETPDLQTTTEYELGDNVELKHGRVMTHERNLGEGGQDTSYEQPLVENKRELTGNESNSYSGSDITTRSGKNTDTRKESGTKTIAVQDKGKNTVTVYDAQQFRAVVQMENILNPFIDEFEPLFNSVILFM